jgi:glycosyltransferase involved in cell wall biosynthesis
MLKWFEKIAVKYSDEIITDNIIIKDYVKEIYNIDSHFIAYGGNHAFKLPLQDSIKQKFNLPNKYAFKVCRIEPENNIELILNAFCSFNGFPLVIVGNWNSSKYSKMLKYKYSTHKNLILLDAIYDYQILNQIRSNSYVYIHGHSAGGTNPSLVEAMCTGLAIFAFDVPYNKATTYNKAIYFKSRDDLFNKLNNNSDQNTIDLLGKEMFETGMTYYKWESICQEYLKLFLI